MIQIRYFGVLQEQLGCQEEQVDYANLSSDELLTRLRERGEPWASALAADKIFKVVLNQEILHAPAQIPDGAEVGILPPVTGG